MQQPAGNHFGWEGAYAVSPYFMGSVAMGWTEMGGERSRGIVCNPPPLFKKRKTKSQDEGLKQEDVSVYDHTRSLRSERREMSTIASCPRVAAHAHRSRSSAPVGAPPPPLLGTVDFTNDPNPPPASAGGRIWFCAPHIPAWAFSFSRSLILFAPAAPPPGLLAVPEPSDIVHKSSNPPPPPPPTPPPPSFVDVIATEGEPAVTGDVTADRADIGLIAGIAANAGAVAGVELGRTCDEDGTSAVLNAPKDWGCAD